MCCVDRPWGDSLPRIHVRPLLVVVTTGVATFLIARDVEKPASAVALRPQEPLAAAATSGQQGITQPGRERV